MLGLITVLAQEEPNGAILPADLNEVYWSLASFSILVALLAWKAFPPLKKAFNGRTERIRAELEEAEQVRAVATGELVEIRAQLSDADTERRRILTQAKEGAETLEAELIARAEAEVVSMRERAVRDTEASKDQALADLQSVVSDLTMGAAEAVVRNALDGVTQAELIDRYIDQVGASS